MKNKINKMILLYYVGSVVGYIYEVIYCLIAKNKLSNRGILYGPWLPIYGIGFSILSLIYPYRKKYIKVLLSTFVGMSTLEYLIGLLSYKLLHKRYWDYRDEVFNIDGFICLKSIIFFTIGGVLFIYIVYPFYLKLYRRMDKKKVLRVNSVFSILLISDIIATKVIKY